MQKILAITLLLLSNILSYAQKKQFNTRIDTAGKVTINGGQTIILKADTVFIGQLTISQNVADSIYLYKSTTTQDTNGIYSTVYTFGPKKTSPSFNVDITIYFDKPYIPIYSLYKLPPGAILEIGNPERDEIFKATGENGDVNISQYYNKDFKSLRARGIVMADKVNILVKSKERLFARISGVAGSINAIP
jgi:hypothetical protein